MESRSYIPPAALSGIEDWDASVVWSLVPERATWRLVSPNGEVRFLKVSSLDQDIRLSSERDRMAWAAGKLPAPTVLNYGSDSDYEWLLTASLVGVNAIDDGLRSNPRHLVPLLADGLRQFHSISVADCPFDCRLDKTMGVVRRRVASGLVDAERDLHRDHGRLTVKAALSRLERLRPREEDMVVCHGDYCLPNVMIRDGRVSGFVDLGRLGVADRWWDLAVASWSVTWNLGPGWEDLLFDSYGVERNPKKITFYRLLYDLLP